MHVNGCHQEVLPHSVADNASCHIVNIVTTPYIHFVRSHILLVVYLAVRMGTRTHQKTMRRIHTTEVNYGHAIAHTHTCRHKSTNRKTKAKKGR